MKLLTLFLNSILALSVIPSLAQQSSTQTGKIHGHVTNYTGQPMGSGIISLATDGITPTYSFPIDTSGNYAGEAPAGNYTLLYRMPDTPLGQWIDQIHDIVITAGGDLEQNDDMSRADFINDLPDETKKELENLKKHDAAAQDEGKLIKEINDDLQQSAQDLKDADNSRQSAITELGKAAEPAAIDAKAASIRTAKCARVESLMQKALQSLKDSGLAADEAPLLENLGRSQIGLKKYDEAKRAYKRILELQTSGGSPHPAVQAIANAGLGEIYVRTGKTSDAVTAFDTAVQLDSANAVFYLKTEALVFLQAGNAEAQVAAADKAIAADARDPLPWYIKANGEFKKAGIDPASKHYDLPEGCADAYRKYLTLAPNGPYVAEAQTALRRAEKTASAGTK
jgi:tetratricopeptide (TPR) repeat protein